VIDWGAVSVDPHRRLLVVNSTWMPYSDTLIPRAEADRMDIRPGAEARNNRGAPEVGPLNAQAGTPYAARIEAFLSPIGFPCHAPPWGHLSVVDLDTQRIVWRTRLGTSRDSAPLGMDLPMGVFNLGGSIVTESGLVFIAATVDNYLRAFDLSTGRELWRGRLPAGGQATPMTYTSDATGRQYVVISAGGHQALTTDSGDFIVTYALPDRRREAGFASGTISSDSRR
jgi:quinoprotein glucose dehydrogenase